LSEAHQESNDPTPVTIFGRTYHLRGGGQADYLTRLAGMVDGKMREVAMATGTADTLKVAILAALNLADESLQGGDDAARSDGDDHRRVQAMVTLLDAVLEESEPRDSELDSDRERKTTR